MDDVDSIAATPLGEEHVHALHRTTRTVRDRGRGRILQEDRP